VFPAMSAVLPPGAVMGPQLAVFMTQLLRGSPMFRLGPEHAAGPGPGRGLLPPLQFLKVGWPPLHANPCMDARPCMAPAWPLLYGPCRTSPRSSGSAPSAAPAPQRPPPWAPGCPPPPRCTCCTWWPPPKRSPLRCVRPAPDAPAPCTARTAQQKGAGEGRGRHRGVRGTRGHRGRVSLGRGRLIAEEGQQQQRTNPLSLPFLCHRCCGRLASAPWALQGSCTSRPPTWASPQQPGSMLWLLSQQQ
jgi:hypothetical protein